MYKTLCCRGFIKIAYDRCVKRSLLPAGMVVEQADRHRGRPVQPRNGVSLEARICTALLLVFNINIFLCNLDMVAIMVR